METNFTQVKITSQPDSALIRIPIVCTQNPNSKLQKTNHTKNFYPTCNLLENASSTVTGTPVFPFVENLTKNPRSKANNRTTNKWFVASLVLLLVMFQGMAWGQTVLLNPTGDGGFETGTTFAANNWTVVNGSDNTWAVGDLATSYAGNREAYITYKSKYSYRTDRSKTVHFYRDIIVPTGNTNITLSFYWKGSGEIDYDRLLVYTAPTTVTPVAGTPASHSTTLTSATLVFTQTEFQTAYTLQTITLPASLAGTTFRLIFTWQNDANTAEQPPVAIDNISVTSQAPCTNPTVYSVTGGGNYCSGGAGLAVGLVDSETGVTYQLYRGGTTTVGSPVSGTGVAITFGSQTTAGTYTVVATRTTGGCTANMTGNAIVAIDPTSVGGTIAGGTSPICLGTGTGTLTLSGQTGNVTKWQKRVNSGSWTDITSTSTTYSETPTSAGVWDYQAIVQSGTCSTATSSLKSITVSATTVPGSVTGGTSPICLGSSTGTLTLSGQTGTVLKWQKRVNSGTWSDITSTSTTYSETPSSAGTWDYQAIVQSGACSAAASTPVSITVNPNYTPTVGLSASPANTICLGTNVTFTATATNYDGGTVTYNFKVAGTSVQNTTTNTWSSSALANGIIVTCDISVSGGSCLTANTASATPITMTVNPLSVAGTASAIDSEVCSGSTAILTLAGSLGSIQWQQSADGVNNWVSVSGGTGGNSSSYTTANLTTPTWYRAAVNGLCPAVFSNAVQVTVNPRPTSTISGTTTTCTGQSATLSIALTGTAPWSLTYTDGTTSTPVTEITTSPYTFSVPASNKTYTVTALIDANCTAQAGDLTGSATVTVNPGCVMLTTLNPTPTATAPDNQTYTSGVATSPIQLSGTPSGVVFDITGGAAVGLENQTGVTSVPSFTPTSGTATITVTPRANGCTGIGVTYTITIISTPTVTPPANQSYCVGVATTALTLTGTPTGFVFDITGGSSVGLTDQTGLTAIPSFTPVEGTATVTITPKANGFTGTAVSYGITVNPLPTVSAGTPFTKTCTLNATGAVIGETTEPGCTYSWSPATGLSFETASNPFANPLTTTTYTVTKTNSATGCSAQATVVVTVDNTSPTVAPITGTTSVCSGSTTILSSTTAGGIWSTGNDAIATVSSGVVTGVSGGTTNISYTVTGSNGCTTVVSSSVTVKELPSVNAITSQVVCSGSSTTAVTLASTPTGSTFAWTTSATTGITGHTASGTGNIPVQMLSTSAAAAGTVTYTITPTLNGCQGPAGTFAVTVNPLPTLTINTNLYGCVTADLSNAITSFTGTITYPSGQIINSNGGYTIRATIGSCWIEKTVVVTINPLPTVTIGTISPICEGSTSFDIPFTVTGGANQYTLTGTGIVAMTLQALGDSPIAANLTSSGFGTRTFALTVRNSTTGCVSTEVMGSVTVNAKPVVNQITEYATSGVATNIVLPDKDSNNLTLTQYDISGSTSGQTTGTFTSVDAIKNDVLTNLTTGNITVSYHIIPYAGNCAGNSFNLNVIVSPVLTGLTITATKVCAGDPSVVSINASTLVDGNYTVNYTLTGDNSQSATDVSMTVSGNTGTFLTNALTNSGTAILTINSLTVNEITTVFTSGNTCDIIVNAPGTWLGTSSISWIDDLNWCGGVPIASTNVVIPSGTTFSPVVDWNYMTCNNLTISSGAILTIGAAKALTVSGTLTNSLTAGLVLESSVLGTASLIQSTLGVPVPATVSRYISGAAESWHFLSSPVSAQSISGTWLPSGTYGGVGGTGYDLYLWDEPKSCWKYKLNAKWDSLNGGNNNFNIGRGYLYSVQLISQTKTFSGNLNNDIQSIALKYNGTDPLLKGFNLVGNPYPSSIDWKAASGWTRTNLKLSLTGYDMWIYNPSAGNYGVFNSASSTGTNSVTQYIAPMQGFFVRAASAGNLVMNNNIRKHNRASEWKSATIDLNQFSVVVKSAADHTGDEARLLFGYHENQPGAAKLFSPVATAPSLYLPAGGLNYTVRYLTDTIDNPVVPVMFKPGVNGTYTLQCNFEPSQFETVLLEDLKTQNIQDLKISPAYQFSATVSDVANRFALHFAPITTTSLKELPGKITTDGLHITIDLTFVSGPTEVTVYDVLGRKLYEQQIPGETITTLNFNAGRQLLLVKLQNPQGSLCRKIIGSNK